MRPAGKAGRGWLRAAALFAVAYVVPVAQGPVIIAVIFIELALALGVRRAPALAGALLALLIVLPWMPWDSMSYIERAWALVLGAWFVALVVWRPAVRFVSRALAAVTGAAATVAVFLLARPNGWGSLQQAVSQRMSRGAVATIDALQALQGGQAVSRTYVATLDQVVHGLQVVFPAVLGLASLAALGVAWWLYNWLARSDEHGVGPLRDFRFNDHLVWIFVAGLVLLLSGWGGGSIGRVGSNAVVFMGALYALRGLAVVVFFMSGGLSLIGFVLLALGLLFVAPVLVAGAAIIGLGDTWLDIRSRASTA